MPLSVTLTCGIVALLFAGLLVSIYNALVAARNNVGNAWSNLDLILQRRHYELPKLMDISKTHLKHERDLINRLSELRTYYDMARKIEDKVRAENEMRQLLGKLFIAWKQNPDLMAIQNFRQIQDRIAAVEGKIAFYREVFNAAVNMYNNQIAQFPDMLLAKVMKCRRQTFLDVPDENIQNLRMAPPEGSPVGPLEVSS